MEKTYDLADAELTNQQLHHNSYLTTFSFIRGSYGLRISVIGCMELGEIQTEEPILRGIIELRNERIAIIDPRVVNGLESTPIDGQTCIVVVEPVISGQRLKIGVIVEDLSEVLNIASCKMDKQSSQNSMNVNFILKLGRENEGTELIEKISEYLPKMSKNNRTAS